MRPEMTPDEALLRQLPLPLAQLYRRAHNAKTALERHLSAFYLWEASLKLLASVAVVEYAERGPADPQLAEPLHNLARPSLGHWWEFVRLLVPALAERGDEAFQKARALLLGKPRDDCPRAAGLDALLREALEGKAGARATVQFGELFNRLLTFRNAELGHGAAGQRPADFYERMGPALLAGLAEVLTRLDVLAGRRLLFAADVRRLASGNWLVERYDLHGETPRRLESVEVPESDSGSLPRPGRLYLHAAAADAAGRALHPLVVHDAETARTFFLNSRRGERRADYLCYTTGDVVRRDELGGEQRELLARVLGGPVDGPAVEAWAARSQAEEPHAEEHVLGSRTIGEFELISRLGRGGMGVVYRAWQPSLGRQVALKCLLRAGDPKSEARFAREIHALGRVEHPNLVKVFTSGAEGEQWFYAMELVEGADLAAVCTRLASSTAAELGEDDWTAAVSTACERQRQQEHPLSDEGRAGTAPTARGAAPQTTAERHGGRGYIAQVVELVRQAADAVHALHEAGVVHRDVKPGNIVVTADGRHAVLMDLGLAQLADEAEGRLTRTRQFVGTLRYASPEQVLAAGRMDRRADVYSLGATLWELLTLRPLFGADEQTPTPELMLRIQTTDPERPRKYNPRVPRDLEAIVVKCLEKDRVRRYPTAADLAADLGRWQRGEPVLAQPPSLSYLLGKQLRRHRVPVTAAALVLLAGVIGVVVAFLQITDALGREKRAKADAQDKQQEVEAASAEKDRLLSEVARGYCELSDREFQKGNVGDGLSWMLRAYEVAPKDDPRRVSYRRLLAAQGESLARPVGRPLVHGGVVKAVAFSPDGHTALTASNDKTARLWDAATGEQLFVLPHDDKVNALAFSPDGHTALTGSMDKTARLWDVATGKQLGEPLRHDLSVWAVAFSPDGRTLLTGSGDWYARLWDATTGKQFAELRHDRLVYTVAFSPDGRTVLTGSDDKTVRLWDAATGKLRDTLLQGGKVWALALSPDGRTLLTGCEDNTARLWDAVTGEQRAELRHNGMVWAVAFSPDGRIALTGSTDKTAALWDAATGRQLFLLPHDDRVTAVAFSPDGRTALTGSGDQTARLWEVSTGRRLVTFPHGESVSAVAFSPDGLTALTGGDKTARLWDSPSSQEGWAYREGVAVFAVAYSPDGRTMLTGRQDKTAQLWDVANDKPLADLVHGGPVYAVAFSPDGRTALTGSADNTARLWDTATGRQLAELGHGGPVHAVAFSPDGRTLLTGSADKMARLWDTATGKQLVVFPHDDVVYAVALSPDGRTALTGSADTTARLWEAATGSPLATLRHDGAVWAVAFNPDGHKVLTGVADWTARLWDAAGGLPRTTLRHDGAVKAVRFSPDGHTALTGGDDKTTRLWDVATGQPLSLFRHNGTVWAVAFSPDGRTALTGGADKTTRLWKILDPVPDEPRRLRAWVRVLSGKAFDDRGVLGQLGPAEWLRCRDELAAAGGDWRARPESGSWHLVQSVTADANEEWFAALFHLNKFPAADPDGESIRRRLGRAHSHLRQWAPAIDDYTHIIAVSPGDATAWEGRARARAELRQWEGAVADYRQASRIQPDNVGIWYRLGLAHLGGGDAKAYREHCGRMRDRFGKTQDPGTAYFVATLAVVLPDSPADAQYVKLADLLSRSDSSNADTCETVGAVLHRATSDPHFPATAIGWLNRAVELQENGGSVTMQLFLALAHYRLAEKLAAPRAVALLGAPQGYGPLLAAPALVPGGAEAQEWLARAEQQIRTKKDPTWEDKVWWRYLLAEARALLKPAAP